MKIFFLNFNLQLLSQFVPMAGTIRSLWVNGELRVAATLSLGSFFFFPNRVSSTIPLTLLANVTPSVLLLWSA